MFNVTENDFNKVNEELKNLYSRKDDLIEELKEFERIYKKKLDRVEYDIRRKETVLEGLQYMLEENGESAPFSVKDLKDLENFNDLYGFKD